MFYVWLDGHDFRIIEVDGVLELPFNTNTEVADLPRTPDRHGGVLNRPTLAQRRSALLRPCDGSG